MFGKKQSRILSGEGKALKCKVLSQQSIQPDCMLHALVNAGVGTYNELLRSNKSLVEVCASKEYVDRGFFCHPIFIEATLIRKRIDYMIMLDKPIRRLPKKFKGIACVYYNQKCGATHSVAIKNGLVYDSHNKWAKDLKTYKYSDANIIFDFL